MSEEIKQGIRAEFERGTIAAKFTVIHILMNLHLHYDGENELTLLLINPLIDLLKKGPWHAKNLCLKAVCVLYDNLETRMILVV